MKEIATSQCDFAALREGDKCVYADKTDILAKLALRQDAHYFISRPRRFGKSPMLSTLRYMFEGRRDLFKGLKIEKTKWDYRAHTVTLVGIKFDPKIKNIDVPKFETLQPPRRMRP